MTTITFKEKLSISKTSFDAVLEFLEELEDYALWKIMEENKSLDTSDISLLEKKYIWK